MKQLARQMAFALALAMGSPAFAQMTPEGTWRTIDDDTKETLSLVQIAPVGDAMVGKVVKSLKKNPERTVCDLCTDERKDQPIIGMTIIEGATRSAGGDKWVDGEILDPNNGKTYRLELMPMEGGKQLRVRGFIGPFYRTQVWLREE